PKSVRPPALAATAPVQKSAPRPAKSTEMAPGPPGDWSESRKIVASGHIAIDPRSHASYLEDMQTPSLAAVAAIAIFSATAHAQVRFSSDLEHEERECFSNRPAASCKG